MTPSLFLKHESRVARTPLRMAALCSVVGAGLLVGQYALLASVVADVVFAAAGLDAVWPRLQMVLALIAGRTVLAWMGERAAVEAAAMAKSNVRAALLEHLLALGPVRLASETSGDLSALVVDGVEALEPYFARFLPAMVAATVIPLAILVVVAPLDWLSGVVLAVTAPLIPLFMVLIGKGAERLNQRQWARLARMSAHFLEVVQNLTTLKLFNASRREAEMVARVSEDYRLATMSVLRVAFLSALALEFFATVSIALVAVFIGFRLLAGDMEFQRGLFILLLAPEFYLPLRSLGVHYHARMEAIGAATRMVDILARPCPAASGALVFLPRLTAVELEGVRLTYDGGRVGLDGLDLRLEPGTTTALVGASGSGKSSVVSVVLGLVQPQAGRLLLAGRPLEEVGLENWRRRLAWVSQRPYLFRGSVADNIRLGFDDASDDAVRAAARLVGADGFISSLADGYAHPVGERGGGLSGGQVRLVALARAALRDASLLVLDEPTASLDAEAEQAVGEAVRRLAQGRTVLVVAHRLATVAGADHIAVLEGGRVVEQGRHAQLLDQDGTYAALIRAGEVETS